LSPLSPTSSPLPGPDAAGGAGVPAPGPEGLAQSAALVAHLHEEIERAGGAISFSHYMERALYAPGLGYYSGGAAKFGPAGDFVTAPEISPLFGRCIARQVAEVLEAIGGGGVLELGGGSGALAEAALAEAGRAWHGRCSSRARSCANASAPGWGTAHAGRTPCRPASAA
jgi:hypothetical protein